MSELAPREKPRELRDAIEEICDVGVLNSKGFLVVQSHAEGELRTPTRSYLGLILDHDLSTAEESCSPCCAELLFPQRVRWRDRAAAARSSRQRCASYLQPLLSSEGAGGSDAAVSARPASRRDYNAVEDPQLAKNLSDFIELPSKDASYVQSPPEDPQTSEFLRLLSKATEDPHFSPKKLCKLGLDISVAWFYHRLINPSPGYLEMLNYYDYDSFEAHGAITGFTAFKHANGSRIIVPDIETGKLNPCRCFKKMRNSASRTFKKISAVPPIQFVVHLGLTFPQEISGTMLNSPSDIEPRLWAVYKDFFKRLEDYLAKGQLGHQANLHPWGSENPLEPHAHFHADLLGAFKVGDHLRPLPFNHGRPLDHHVVRSLWAKSVSEEFDIGLCSCLVIVDLPGLEVCPICLHRRADVHLEWSHRSWVHEDAEKFPYKLLHKIKYRKRGALIDLAEFYLKHEWDPSHASDFLSFLLVYKNKSRSFGFWTNISYFVCECPPETPRLPCFKACPVCLKPLGLCANRAGSLCPLCGESCTTEKLHFEDIRDFVLAFITRKGKLRLSRWGMDRVEPAREDYDLGLALPGGASPAMWCNIVRGKCDIVLQGRCPLSGAAICPKTPDATLHDFQPSVHHGAALPDRTDLTERDQSRIFVSSITWSSRHVLRAT